MKVISESSSFVRIKDEMMDEAELRNDIVVDGS